MMAHLLLTLVLFAGQASLPVAEGSTVDTAGQPIPGATIYVVQYDTKLKLVGQASSDESGTFRITQQQAGDRTASARTLLFHKNGHGLAAYQLDHATLGAAVPIRVVLEPITRRRIQVRDAGGQPLAHAAVAPDSFGNVDGWGSVPGELTDRFTRRTDDQGECVIDYLSNSYGARLDVVHDAVGTQSVFSRASDTQASYRLRAIGAVRGQLTANDMSAVAGARVTFSSRPVTEVENQPVITGEAETITDEQGRFQIPALAAGNVTARVGFDDHVVYRANESYGFQLAAGATYQLPVDLHKATRVKGQVLDHETRQPLSGVRLRVQNQGTLRFVTTDEAGGFFAIAGAGHLHVSVLVPEGYIEPVQESRGATLAAAQAEVQLEAFHLKPARVLKGIAVSETNEPVAHAWITAQWTQQDGRLSTSKMQTVRSRIDGSFQIANVSKSDPIKIYADTPDCALARAVDIAADKTDEITLRLTSAAVAVVRGRVVDQAGNPVPDAKIEITGGSRKLGGRYSYHVGERFNNQWKMTTDAEGRFQTKTALRRSKYNLVIQSEGMVDLRKSGFVIQGKQDPIVLPDFSLSRVRTITGVVANRDGLPIAGARVFSYGHEGFATLASATTASNGSFSLSQVHADSRLIFVDAGSAYRFTGAALGANDQPVSLVATRRDAEAGAEIHTRVLPKPAQRRLLNALLKPVVDHANKVNSRYGLSESLQRLARDEPDFVLDQLGPLKGTRYLCECLFVLQEFAEGVQVAEQINSPDSRAYQYWQAATRSQDHAQKLSLLQVGTFHAKTIQNPGRKVERFAGLVKILIQLGEKEAAGQLIDELLPTVEQLGQANRAAFSRGYFAETVALLDLDQALALIENLKDEDEFDRHHGNIAVIVAAQSPARSEQLLQKVRNQWERDKRGVGVCHRIANIDRPRAERIAAAIQQPELQAYAYGVMALALGDTDPAASEKFLRQAFDRFADQLRASQQRRNIFPTAMALVHIAERVAPAAVEEFFWRAVSIYPGPDADPYSPGDQAKYDAKLMILLSAFDQLPDLAAELLTGVLPEIKKLKPTDYAGHSDRDVLITALALADPTAALDWHREFLPGATKDSLQSVPQAFKLIADAVSKEGDELWNHLYRELFHVWVVGDEDY